MVKPYYQDSSCTIYNCRWEDIIDDIEYNSVITDPPYNVSKRTEIKRGKSKPINQHIGDWDYDYDPTAFISQLKKVPTAIFTSHLLFGDCVSALHAIHGDSGCLCWCKTNPAPSVRKSTYTSSVELIATSSKKINYLEHWSTAPNWIATGVCGGNERLDHPSQKPVQVMKLLVDYYGVGTVFDPFAGVGTTAVACRKAGLFCVCSEASEYYCKQAADRLAQQQFVLTTR